MTWLDIEWAGLYRDWWLPVFALVILIAWWSYQRKISVLQILTHQLNVKITLPNFSYAIELYRVVLFSIAAIMLAIAILQPQWGEKEETVMQQGRDVIIALDISRSMLAQDIKPSRLEFAKLKIKKLLRSLSFERIALVLFSGTAFLQCPLTADYKTLELFLDQVSVEAISSGTTDISNAIKESVGVFNRSKERKNKLLILMTDGEDFVSNTSSLSSLIKKEGVTVFAWGVGTSAGAPVPIVDMSGRQLGYEKNSDGSVALTKLNSDLLSLISQSLGGMYLTLSQDDSDIATLVQSLAGYETETFDEQTVSRYHDQYPWFIGIAWLALLLEWVL